MIKVYDDKDVVVSLEWSEVMNSYFIHTDVKAWSLSKYRKFLGILGKLTTDLHARGFEYLYALPPTEKEEKWEELFGFEDSGERIGDYKLMRLHNGN